MAKKPDTKKASRITAIIAIVLVVAMVLTTIIAYLI